MNNHIVSLLLSVTLLTGCGGATVDEIRVSAEPVKKPVLILPEADVLNLRSVDWIVITPENFQEKIKMLTDKGDAPVFFAVTTEGYERLSLNINDLRTHIEQKNSIILAYRRYYVQSETAIDQANTTIQNSFLR